MLSGMLSGYGIYVFTLWMTDHFNKGILYFMCKMIDQIHYLLTNLFIIFHFFGF